MEPRSAIGEYDAASDRLILRLGCQGVFGQRNLVSGILGIPVEKLRVLTGNVGGSFGMKSSVFPEYPCVLFAAKLLGRPVKWTDERSESFVSDNHGRDHDMTVVEPFAPSDAAPGRHALGLTAPPGPSPASQTACGYRRDVA